MHEQFIPRPLPAPVDYESAIRHVDTMLTPSPEAANKILRRQIHLTESSKAFSDMATKLGVLIEPINSATEKPFDEQWGSSRAFLLGSLAGLMVARELHGDHFHQSSLFDNVPPLAVPSELPKYEFRHAYAEKLLLYGEQGLETLGEKNVHLVESISDRVIQKPVANRVFVRAFGIVTLTAYGIHENRLNAYNREAIEMALETPEAIDWDAAMRSLSE
jgi:hypothetical protein